MMNMPAEEKKYSDAKGVLKCSVMENLGHLATSRGLPHDSKTSHLNVRKSMRGS